MEILSCLRLPAGERSLPHCAAAAEPFGTGGTTKPARLWLQPGRATVVCHLAMADAWAARLHCVLVRGPPRANCRRCTFGMPERSCSILAVQEPVQTLPCASQLKAFARTGPPVQVCAADRATSRDLASDVTVHSVWLAAGLLKALESAGPG